MMKIATFVILAGLLLATAACAVTTYTETIYAGVPSGDNWIALRGVPFYPDPVDVFGDLMMIDDARLSWLNAPTGSVEPYYSFQEPDGPFGKMLLGVGYTALNDSGSNYTIQYVGLDDGVPDESSKMTDMWISLPGLTGGTGGEHWVGFPFDHPVAWEDVQVTDGTQTIDVQTAVGLGWLDMYWQYRDGASQDVLQVDPDGIVGDSNLLPGAMYIVQTYKSNIALIIPA